MLLNRPRAERILTERGLAAVVATSPANVASTSGYWSMTHWSRPGPQVFSVLPLDATLSSCVITGSGALDHVVDGEAWVTEAYRYGFFATVTEGATSDAERRYAALLQGPDHGDPVTALVAALRDRKLDRSRIAVDEVGISAANHERLKAELTGAEIVPGAGVIREIRKIKTAEEIDRLRGAVRATERGIEAALKIARAGVTERELEMEFNRAVIAAGGLPVAAMCIGSGPRSALSNCMAGDRALRAGEVVRFDGGVRVKLYRSDIARIGALGDPGDKARRYYRALRLGVEQGIAAIRPGVRTADIFATVMDTVKREGIPHYERNHTGHGIGIDNYDAPDLAPKSADVIEEGMVLCVETPYYELGFAGLQLENTVVVRAHGAEPLTTLSNDLLVV